MSMCCGVHFRGRGGSAHRSPEVETRVINASRWGARTDANHPADRAGQQKSRARLELASPVRGGEITPGATDG